MAAVHEYASDPEVTRFVAWGRGSLDETRQFVTRVVNQSEAGLVVLAITLRDGRAIGTASLFVESEQDRRGGLGYALSRAYWGQGYATETTRRLVRYGFDELDLHRIEATCHPDNRASARVLEKAGFQFEGRLRDHLLVRGQWRDSLLYATVSGD